MNYFSQDKQKVLTHFNVTSDNGLSDQSAIRNREIFGENKINEEKPKSAVRVFLEQFSDLLVIILIIAAFISIFTGNLDSSLVIFAVIIMNAILGTAQHIKAQKSLESLKAMSSPSARVIRNSVVCEIPASEVVVGDIILIEAGNVIPADARLLETASLQVNESALTGESVSILKTSDALPDTELSLGDRVNMVYSGSTVTNGRGVAVVTAVGMNSEIGKIATLMQNAKKKQTPLQASLDKFGQILSFAIIGICAVVFVLTMFVNGQPFEDAIMFAIALAVAAIPEALSSIITISLAIGTQKMSKQKAIIKELKAVEGLGCVSVICSDKTGTLTQNKMTVCEVIPFCQAAEYDLRLAMALCNDSAFSENDWLGDPTETALAAYLGHTVYSDIRKQNPRVDELPFDSDRKLMSTVHTIESNKTIFTKGAIDVLLARAKQILTEDGVRDITDDDLEKIRSQNLKCSENGMRVLAFGLKLLADDTKVTADDEQDYIYVGMVAMTDPPRAESKKAVEDCLSAGIKPIMITGDHKITAVAIAKEIGIYKDGDRCFEGSELDAISDEKLSSVLEEVSVYARVSPAHKIRIVELWQQRGNVVSMTGDGVNDAPALKKADIGVAMGITGTEVSKDASSMILADDNFATIVKAVANGRAIYGNIKNAIKFLLAGNAAAIIVVLVTTLFNLPLPFTPVHLLFINLLTDSLPAIALCMEPMQPGIMKEPPRPSRESILNLEIGSYIAFHGMMIAACVMIAFMIGNSVSAGMASTMAFATLCLARLFEGFDSRGKYSLFKLGISSNLYSLGAFVLGAALLAIVLFVPALRGFMDVSADITMLNILQILVFASIPFVITQIIRVIKELFVK